MVAGGPPLASLQSKEREWSKVRINNYGSTHPKIKYIEIYIDICKEKLYNQINMYHYFKNFII